MDAEHDLDDDAPWKKTQEYTFTRWVNQHLKTAQTSIESLETDLCDGVALITLIEVLSGRSLPKHNRKPTNRSQMLENVQVALQFLAKVEGIHVVNIGPSDIVDGKLKLILGLIWHLILHYSIASPNWEDDENYGSQSSSYGNSLTPNERLLLWIQNRVPALSISNFTRDWNDGRALGCLVNSFAPGLCPNWYQWNSRNALLNVQNAMELAEMHLGIPQLIRPEEMINPGVDEQSMMTYLSQFRNAKIKPIESKLPRLKEMSTKQRNCKAFGPGLEFGTANQPNRFTIDTKGVGTTATLGLAIEGPSETQVACTDNRNGYWTVEYKPSEAGNYRISIRIADQHITGSPFEVRINNPLPFGEKEPNACECEKCKATISPKHVEKNTKQPKGDDYKYGHENKQREPLRVSIVGTNSAQCTTDYENNVNAPEPEGKGRTVTLTQHNTKTGNSKSRDDVVCKTTIEIRNGKVSPKDVSTWIENSKSPKPNQRRTSNSKPNEDDMDVHKSHYKEGCPCKVCKSKSKSKCSSEDNDDNFQDTFNMSSTVVVTNHQQDTCCCV